jgi:hypothetical protein
MDSNSNSTIQSTATMEELGTMYYMESGYRVFYTLRKQISGEALKVNDDLKSYLDMYFIQIENNWNIIPGKNTPTVKKYPVKLCDVHDFEFDLDAESIIKTWKGFDLICPDIPSPKSLYLSGEQSSVISSVFGFTIDRCHDKAICKSKSVINDFIKDIQLDTWEVS